MLIVILQNEIPMSINVTVAEFARKSGVPVMFNPAPSTEIPTELISCLTYISPNEAEAYDMTGIVPKDRESILSAIEDIGNMGVPFVLMTLGKNGAAYKEGKNIYFSPCVSCGAPVDPTAAGVPTENSLEFANCAAGITVSRKGAQTSLPKLAEVLDIMKINGYRTDYFSVLNGDD